jgi:hypothetical protein
VNRVTITTIISNVFVVMLVIGLGILFIPPMVVAYTVMEEAMDSPILLSTLPGISFALLFLGLAGLGVQGLLKNKLDLRPRQR